ncbi:MULTISPECIES: AraC family transcriptional regulator [unclassified Pseudodesulfovibrio]|uniref:helix-turn-helix transcriptional regulator n=2 Tax=unclassified Pseudodesulfovibrio TaxID=2661612 RepID=UPI000FEC035B|nr:MULTISPECIES: AraC family transcriptional regulator [unclassified Pseudodesulfovibrio]MCJ2163377.1 AraC family transcriptional regulator [Pseudodesulfovibrio sp. S3-i]RWU06871.1 AraC family transcriptional regulator [Pseudodesulfovibrio sp. S3]
MLKYSRKEGITGPRTFQSCKLRPGLTLTIAKPSQDAPLKTSFDMDDAPIQFGFTLSGKNRCLYSSGGLRNQTNEMQTGSNGILYLPKTCGTLEQPSDNPACILGITVSPELLCSYFADNLAQLPKQLRMGLEGCKETPTAWFGSGSPIKQCLLTQILDCPYTGGMRKLFLESRAMELMAMQIHEYILSESQRHPKQARLCPADVERIRHARDILVRDLENPPSLPELAAQIGVNEKKLKTGFRQVYSTSVFGYFRDHRMHKAYKMLQQGNHNVTEVAYAVGYQSLSHFSHAFKKLFGILPKDFLTSQRRLLAS